MDAHIPALGVLPGFEIVAVCTRRQESADEAARHLGVPLAFTDPARLAQHPDVDLVAVSVRVPAHHDAVAAAAEAGKHVYCEWPLGRNLAEGRAMLDSARRAGIHHLVGLQARQSPSVNYVRDLLAQGEIGRVLSASVTVCSPRRDPTSSGAYMLDRDNGMNPLTIAGGHTLDLVRYCLGDFVELAASEINQYPAVTLADTGAVVEKSTLDQLLVQGIVGDGIALSYQLRGGGAPREPRFSFEIHGEDGDLLLTSLPTTAESMQRQHLTVWVGRGGPERERRDVPDRYRVVPAEMPPGAPFNVGQMYARLGEAIRTGEPTAPGFDVGVSCHRLLDAVTRSSESGRRQDAADIAGS